MIDYKEYQKKSRENSICRDIFFLIASIMLIFVVYDPTFSIFENKKSALIYSGLIEEKDKTENGIHHRTGLIDAEGLITVVNNCTNCNSAKLVVQNKMSAESWNTTIKWM